MVCIGRRGHKYFIVARCRLSKYIIVAPLKNKSGVTVATWIYHNIILRFCGITKITTDNGGEFRNKWNKHLKNLFGYKHGFITPRRPQGNGGAENGVKIFKYKMDSHMFERMRQNNRTPIAKRWDDDWDSFCAKVSS